MTIQYARRQNLKTILADLERQGVTSWAEQSKALGSPVTPSRLQGMTEGRDIGAFFAAHVEHALGKPRGWMDRLHGLDEYAPPERGLPFALVGWISQQRG